MEAIRSIQIVDNGAIHLQLPEQFWGQEVEIIVLTSPLQTMQPITHKKSLRGCLSRYAKSDLIDREQDVWQAVVGEKHEHR